MTTDEDEYEEFAEVRLRAFHETARYLDLNGYPSEVIDIDQELQLHCPAPQPLVGAVFLMMLACDELEPVHVVDGICLVPKTVGYRNDGCQIFT